MQNRQTRNPVADSPRSANSGGHAPQPTRRPRTPEEEAQRKALMEKRREEALRREKEAKEKKEKRMNRLSRIVALMMVLCGLMLIGGLAYWGITTLLGRREAGKDHSFTLTHATYCAENGCLYFDMNDLAERLDWTVVGDKEEMTFVLTKASTGSDENQSIRLFSGRTEAELNGEMITLISPVLLKNAHYWVPFDFINAHMNGLLIDMKDTNYPRLIHQTEKDEEGVVSEMFLSLSVERKTEIPPEFTTETSEEITQPPETTEPPVTTPPVTEDPVLEIIRQVTFSQDLSSYEAYMNPDGEMRDAFLVLINRQSTASAEDVPASLVKINTKYTYNGRTVEMNETAAKAMEAMFKELFAAGFKTMHITSGYRSFDAQKKLYNTYVDKEINAAKEKGKKLSREQAEAIVDTYSARAGTSEHQSGLCADMHNLSSADVKFAKEKPYQWLCDNAWKFGFILRFPEGKEEITGYSFEPWHYRFVGRYHAYKIWSEALTLEEYLSGWEAAAGNSGS